MKVIVIGLITLSAICVMATTVRVKSINPGSEKICDSIQSKYDEDCAHIMCDDLIAIGTFENMTACTRTSDYAEGAQGACDNQPTVEDLVKEYNKKNSSAKITCN